MSVAVVLCTFIGLRPEREPVTGFVLGTLPHRSFFFFLHRSLCFLFFSSLPAQTNIAGGQRVYPKAKKYEYVQNMK